MALWKDSNSGFSNPQPAPAPPPPPAAVPPHLRDSNVASLPPADAGRRAAKDAQRFEMRESVIASDITIEGKIVGTGHVRIAGRFKGDVHVDGNVTLDHGSHVEGQIQAAVVVVGGELIGNIDNAKRVELLETGILTGDVRAGSLTVAAGSRMRGKVEFGFEESRASFEAKGFGSA
jgi:cytoskeletal protein CcmA (bactofilin family)